LMVEEKLKLLRILQAVSSEKADRKMRYTKFKIFAMPFPGYEYFAACNIYAMKLRESEPSKHHHEFLEDAFNDIQFSWDSLCSADNNVSKVLDSIPNESIHPQIRSIQWKEYKQWHIEEITKNYMKLLISSFAAKKNVTDEPFNDGGVLVHCIMGWDRTPTFISMLRLSLWADGVVNPSLTPEELVYLSIAYDWLSFGHNLVYRSKQGVELMFYCFNFLLNLKDPEYSFQYALGNEEEAKEKNQKRIAKLKSIQDVFLPIYKETFKLI